MPGCTSGLSPLTSSRSSSGVAGALSVRSVLQDVSDNVSESTDSSSNPKNVSTTCFCERQRAGHQTQTQEGRVPQPRHPRASGPQGHPKRWLGGVVIGWVGEAAAGGGGRPDCQEHAQSQSWLQVRELVTFYKSLSPSEHQPPSPSGDTEPPHHLCTQGTVTRAAPGALTLCEKHACWTKEGTGGPGQMTSSRRHTLGQVKGAGSRDRPQELCLAVLRAASVPTRPALRGNFCLTFHYRKIKTFTKLEGLV